MIAKLRAAGESRIYLRHLNIFRPWRFGPSLEHGAHRLCKQLRPAQRRDELK
ncbi:hypothetical protein SAMN05444920_10170 [Nonomuraea solani]|uniref:Uncharacterized protein n=1 Tax=Nonomuraea solani TaxID=1144553 RepID=A0A1H5SZR1_9ACTN|nr:hypothetical protein SAMN05444920_10170 [Nonomuraea solani]